MEFVEQHARQLYNALVAYTEFKESEESRNEFIEFVMSTNESEGVDKYTFHSKKLGSSANLEFGETKIEASYFPGFNNEEKHKTCEEFNEWLEEFVFVNFGINFEDQKLRRNND